MISLRHVKSAACRLACLLAGGALTSTTATAFVLDGNHWPSNQPIILNLQLGSPGRTLIDGSTRWNQVAEAAAEAWNPYLGSGVQFQTNETVLTPAERDGKNTVFFCSTIYGDTFGSDTLAITLSFYNSSTHVKGEADVLVNSAKPYDSIVLPILQHCVLSHVGQVAAHQGEMVIAIGLPNAADALQRRLVADMAAEGIARIGGVNDDPSTAQHLDGLAHEAPLRRHRMQLQIDVDVVGYDTRMNQIIEWLPLIVFFLSFKLLGSTGPLRRS